MFFYVLGIDPNGNLIALTNKPFFTRESANHYASTCSPIYKSFVVAEVAEPVAWRWLYNGEPDSDKCFPMPGPDADVIDRAAKAEFPRTAEYLYKM